VHDDGGHAGTRHQVALASAATFAIGAPRVTVWGAIAMAVA
jgi:hypothetical protein